MSDLRFVWSKREGNHMIHYPRKCDGHLLHYLVSVKSPSIDFDRLSESPKGSGLFAIKYNKSFLEELEDRGYDVKTLKISCKLKEQQDDE